MSSGNLSPLTMPKWGLSMKEGKLLTWLINEGDSFNKGDEVAEVETEKIAGVVEAPCTGTLRKIIAENDTTSPVGALLAVVADQDVSDAELNAFIDKFQAEFVPEEESDEEEASASEFVEVNSLRIRYVSKGDGDEVILLIHGFGGDLDNWLFNHDDLVEKTGNRVIAIDLPGHGQSTKSVGEGTLAFFADTLDAFLKAINVKNAHLVGHSMGAGVALQLAEKRPESVLSLGLICPAGLGTEINTDYLSGFVDCTTRKQIKPYLQQLFRDEELVTRALINNILQYKRLDGVDKSLNIIKEKFVEKGKQKYQYAETLKTFHGNACVIWGEDDQIIPVEHVKNLPDNIRALTIPAGHMVQMEAAKQVNQFLSETILS